MKIVWIIWSVLIANSGFGQKLLTKNASISFFSKTSMENISAINKKAVSVWDVGSGQIEFSVLMKGFEFEKALMQDHFNENYVESDKYPKSTFKGQLTNRNIPLSTDGNFTSPVTGTLTLHGVSNPVNTMANFTVKNAVVSATATFIITLKDYNIAIPSLVADNISKTISITINVPAYNPMSAK